MYGKSFDSMTEMELPKRVESDLATFLEYYKKGDKKDSNVEYAWQLTCDFVLNRIFLNYNEKFDLSSKMELIKDDLIMGTYISTKPRLGFEEPIQFVQASVRDDANDEIKKSNIGNRNSTFSTYRNNKAEKIKWLENNRFHNYVSFINNVEESIGVDKEKKFIYPEIEYSVFEEIMKWSNRENIDKISLMHTYFTRIQAIVDEITGLCACNEDKLNELKAKLKEQEKKLVGKKSTLVKSDYEMKEQEYRAKEQAYIEKKREYKLRKQEYFYYLNKVTGISNFLKVSEDFIYRFEELRDIENLEQFKEINKSNFVDRLSQNDRDTMLEKAWYEMKNYSFSQRVAWRQEILDAMKKILYLLLETRDQYETDNSKRILADSTYNYIREQVEKIDFKLVAKFVYRDCESINSAEFFRKLGILSRLTKLVGSALAEHPSVGRDTSALAEKLSLYNQAERKKYEIDLIRDNAASLERIAESTSFEKLLNDKNVEFLKSCKLLNEMPSDAMYDYYRKEFTKELEYAAGNHAPYEKVEFQRLFEEIVLIQGCLYPISQVIFIHILKVENGEKTLADIEEKLRNYLVGAKCNFSDYIEKEIKVILNKDKKKKEKHKAVQHNLIMRMHSIPKLNSIFNDEEIAKCDNFGLGKYLLGASKYFENITPEYYNDANKEHMFPSNMLSSKQIDNAMG